MGSWPSEDDGGERGYDPEVGSGCFGLDTRDRMGERVGDFTGLMRGRLGAEEMLLRMGLVVLALSRIFGGRISLFTHERISSLFCLQWTKTTSEHCSACAPPRNVTDMKMYTSRLAKPCCKIVAIHVMDDCLLDELCIAGRVRLMGAPLLSIVVYGCYPLVRKEIGKHKILILLVCLYM